MDPTTEFAVDLLMLAFPGAEIVSVDEPASTSRFVPAAGNCVSVAAA